MSDDTRDPYWYDPDKDRRDSSGAGDGSGSGDSPENDPFRHDPNATPRPSDGGYTGRRYDSPPSGSGYGATGGGQHSYRPPASIGHPQATTILVLGILGVLCCGPVGIAAFVMGQTARREITRAERGTYNNEGTITAGWILGIIATGLTAFQVIAVFAFLI